MPTPLHPTKIASLEQWQRSAIAAYESSQNYATAVCIDCGATFPRSKGRVPKRCQTCAYKRMTSSASQQLHKQGPAYEKAVRKQCAYWLGEANRLGLTLD